MPDRSPIRLGLESPREELRLQAVAALVKSADMEAARVLKKLSAEDPSPQVRYFAQKGLDYLSRRVGSEISPAAPRGKEDILGRLGEILEQGHRDVKIRALQSIALHGFKEALPRLLSQVETEEDPFVRSKLLLTIGMLGGREQVPILAAATKDEDFRIRANAVEALEYIGHRSIYPSILDCLRDGDHRVRANAVKALRNYGRQHVLEILDEMLSSEEVRMRDAALFACLTFEPDVSVPRVARLLEDETPAIRKKAHRSLEQLAERGCEAAAKALAGHETDPSEAEGVLDFFTLLDGGLSLEKSSRDRLLSEDFRVRLAAIHEMVKEGRSEDWTRLLDRLPSEEDVYVKATMLTAMGTLAGVDAVPHVLPYLESDEPRLRANAIEALGEIGGPENLERIRPFARDPGNRARGNALVALAGDPETDVYPHLEEMVASSDETMRLTACYVVQKLATDEAVERIVPLTEDPARAVRNKALQTLAALAKTSEVAAEIVARKSVETNVERVLALEFGSGDAGQMKTSLQVEKLLFDLSSEDAAVRENALELLADIGDETALPDLVQAALATRSEERLRARQTIAAIMARELGRGGARVRTQEAGWDDLDYSLADMEVDPVPCLRDVPADEIPQTVSQVLTFALRTGKKGTVRRLRELAEDDSLDPGRLGLVLFTAGLLGATDLLVRYLGHEDPRVRGQAMEGVEGTQWEVALRSLIPCLSSRSRTVRHNAIRALRLFPRKKVLSAARKLLAAPEARLRESGIYVLTKMRFDETLQVLIAYLGTEDDHGLARKAAGTVAMTATPADVAMIEALLEGEQDERRAALIRKILTHVGGGAPGGGMDASAPLGQSTDLSRSSMDDGAAKQQWLDDLSHKDPEVRKAALAELARTRDTSLMPLIRKVAFTDADARVAFFARNVHDNLEAALLPHVELKKKGETRLNMGRLTGYLESPDPKIRVAAIKKAVTIGERRAVALLEKHLKSEADEWVLATLLTALGEMGDGRLIGSLAPFLKRKDPRIRSVTLVALGELGDESAFPLMTPCLDDDDAEVSEVAFCTLRRMGEEDLVDHLHGLCGARRKEMVELGVKLLTRMTCPAALRKQVLLLSMTADRVVQNKVEANLSERGTLDMLLDIEEMEARMEIVPAPHTDRVKKAIMDRLGMSAGDVKQALEDRRKARTRETDIGEVAPVMDEAGASSADGGMVRRLSKLFTAVLTRDR